MPTNEKVISDLQSSDKDVRFAAWRTAGDADPSVIPDLGKLVASSNPGVSKAAREALTTMVHSVGKDSGNPKRAAVVKGLVTVAVSNASELPARVAALRLLSNIAGDDAVADIAKLLHDPQLREEAVYCLERIPGETADRALLAAAKSSKEDFQPRLLAALGHRRVAEGTPICLQAMRSSNAEVAAAGARALGRIGKKASGTVNWPKPEDPDATLRYADGLREHGSSAEAMSIYKRMLHRPEEHVQCAAIVGLSRIKTSEAAAVIYPFLKNNNRRVRITATNAWKAIAMA